jgi:hypothetical protein
VISGIAAPILNHLEGTGQREETGVRVQFRNAAGIVDLQIVL